MTAFPDGGTVFAVVGLGNPGTEYRGTRHNMGFDAVEILARRLSASPWKKRAKGLECKARTDMGTVLLVQPQTFMNLSGEAVIQAVRFYKIPPEHVIVVSDEISLPIGTLRIRVKGSAGGHNGLKNIIAQLGTDAFPRIRIGVGAPPHPDYDMADWVLSAFKDQDAVDMRDAALRAAHAAECYITDGADRAMNRFN